MATPDKQLESVDIYIVEKEVECIPCSHTAESNNFFILLDQDEHIIKMYNLLTIDKVEFHYAQKKLYSVSTNKH